MTAITSSEIVAFGRGPILRSGLVPQQPEVVRARQVQDGLTYEQAEGRILDELWVAHLNQFSTSECFAHAISCAENLDYLVAARVQQIHDAFHAGAYPVINYKLRNDAHVVDPILVTEAPGGSPLNRPGLATVADSFKSFDQIRAEQRANLSPAQRAYHLSRWGAGVGAAAYAASLLLAGSLPDAVVSSYCPRSEISQSIGDYRESAIDQAVADCRRPGLSLARGLRDLTGVLAVGGLVGSALLAGGTALSERERLERDSFDNAVKHNRDAAARQARLERTVEHNATLIPGRGHFHRLVAELVVFNSVCDSTGKPALASFLASVPRIQRCEIWLLLVDALSKEIAKADNLTRVSAGLAAFAEIEWNPYVSKAFASWRTTRVAEHRQVSAGGIVDRYQQELASGLTVATADRSSTVTGNLVALILAQVDLREACGGTTAGDLAVETGFTRQIKNSPEYGHLLSLAQHYDKRLNAAAIRPLLDGLVGAGLIEVRTTATGGARWFPVRRG